MLDQEYLCSIEMRQECKCCGGVYFPDEEPSDEIHVCRGCGKKPQGKPCLTGMNRFATGELSLGYCIGQIYDYFEREDKDQYCTAVVHFCGHTDISDEEVAVIDAWKLEEKMKQTIEDAITALPHVPTANLVEELKKREVIDAQGRWYG